nr:ATP-binding protein [Butyrivibrio sp. AE2032]
MWDVNANITVSMFDNRIEITSPGGLVTGISIEEYLEGGLLLPRNPIICYVFLRLNLIERFGTGIRRIGEAYSESLSKPVYNVMENMIRITLPIVSADNEFSEDEGKIMDLLNKYGNISMSSSKIAELTNMGKTKVVSILNKLVDNGYI